MSIKYIIKRDETKVPFDSKKIKDAVMNAARSVELDDETIGEEVTQEVLSYLKIFYKDEESGVPDVEQVQDLVEKVLIEKGYAEVAKSYILYREQHKKIRDTRALFNDALEAMDDYLQLDDWKVNENSNMGYSLQGLNNFISSEVTAQYWLQEIYSEEVREKHNNGDFHVHDLGNLSVYCCGWDLQDLLQTGFRGVSTKIESEPPKHLKTALGQIVNFFFTLQGEAAGAMAFSNFDTHLAPFIAYDGLDYEEVKQAMQEFLFNMNVPTRVGFQTPFTNITMDLNVPEFMKDQPVIIGGEDQDRTYGEFQKEQDMFNRAFAELMQEGDAKGRVFSFPIPTYNITSDFEWGNEVLDPLWEMTAKYGIPYFSNFVNSDMDPEDARSMCLFPEESIFVKQNGEIKETSIGDMFSDYKGENIADEWYAVDTEIRTLSLNPKTGKLEWAKVSKFLQVDADKIVNIKLPEGKRMKVTPEHPLAVMKETGIGFKKAVNVTEDDLLLVQKNDSRLFKDGNEIDTSKYSFNDAKLIPPAKLSELNFDEQTINWFENADFGLINPESVYQEKLESKQIFYDIELGKNHYFVHSHGNISHNCCRLRLDNRELRKRGGGLFGANPMTGSVGVVTINLARIGHLARDENDFMERIYELMDLAKGSLEVKRRVLENLTEQGLYPYARFYLRDVKKRFDEYWKNHFNTIGINGMNEALINFMGKNIASPEGRSFALQVMDLMRERMVAYQEETGNLYNLEATPAEGTTYRLAKMDKERFGSSITVANEDKVKSEGAEPYYTNSTHLPVGYTSDIFTALDLQDELQQKYTGGTVLHGFLGERMPDIESTKKMVKRIAENYSLPYYTLTPTFSICPEHGYLAGEHEYCPKCAAEE